MSSKKALLKTPLFQWKHLLLLFVFFPLMSEYIEIGHFPETLKDWTAELIMTLIIGITITIIYRQYNLLEKLSLLDYLTGISNRRQFEIDLKREILRTKRMKTGLVLIFFDLNGFKEINDRFGHEKGDTVLIEFAHALSLFTRKETDFCYRFGGDEFAVLFTGIENKEMLNIENIIEDRLSTIVYSKLPQGVSVSKGLVILQENENYNELLRRADDAMYRAKRTNKTNE